ncbi:MAG: galactose-1-phosphate uridylyltransferase [bacterium (Candidatus Ratteibacteria) CG_4_10_14_3_um_filter_41_18]|uniref:Galactose-1-phosphate uridylyltransferase n=4 Tax=Candidatus Ratteibacteria TaxID=2979319 RepID=A0A2M7E6R7_9BACT|nr:MAG: galactose-1-phosphate uridylyltransferase [bacterium (Candidatus Ratteibacteria) CG01_land_8_20_14_3_00_40_19]PIX76607.1 MAG: galactose-1-phosphate uridylyltransferase [bacterium (Candidatus Ratteibacteria) CG_4_10_14_3_um_filter_41_18]PJA62125.1 MAG: galactose-1-phosphate uridylyltransferase [bacterium (Candidatus Ratteibacteria) CG_4_9_14_3_um_filter_41_21]HCG77143.1 galactose-1-phosphate uridylyltransferase [bacterium]
MSELRWDPFLEEWVVIASHRLERTFFPPKDYCPLCPTKKKQKFATEIPRDNYEIVVFENKFPSFETRPAKISPQKDLCFQKRPGKGICEVICYSPKHNLTLTDLSLNEIIHLIEVWADRYDALGKFSFIKYVFIFENKGEEIGVTLTHPHGQIYAFPYIPPRIKKELNSSRKYFRKNNRCLFCDIIKEELKSKAKRIIAQNKNFIAIVPFFARWCYEVHILSRAHKSSLMELSADEGKDLAKILKKVLLKYDALFSISFPYIMVMHQKPTDGKDYPYYHFHLEFYPPYRAPGKLKYLAGCESGTGTFINDTIPEEKAKELRKIVIASE